MAVKIPDFKIRENLVVKGKTTLQQTLATSGDSTFGGNATVSGNLHTLGSTTIDGSLTVNGEMTFVESSSIRLEDPLITLGHGNSATDVHDIGFYSTYNNSGIRYTGLFRDASDGIYKLFSNAATDPALSAIDTADSSLTLATLSAQIPGNTINDESIATAKLEADAVTGDKIADSTVNTEHIADNAIQTSHVSAGAITNTKLANDGIIVNNRSVSLGDSVDVPVHEHRDSCSVDIDVGQEVVSGAVTDVLSANVRFSGSTIECVTADCGGCGTGIRVAEEQLTSTHLSAGSIDNDRLTNSAIHVNDRPVSLGGRVEVPVHSHADSCSVDLEVSQTDVDGIMTDTLSANVRFSGSTIECVTADCGGCGTGIRVAKGVLENAHLSGGTFSINGVEANIGTDISISLHGTASATETISLSVRDDDVLIGNLIEGSVGTQHLCAAAVTTAKIAPDAVTSAEVADDAIGNEHLQDDTVDTDNIIAGSVTNAKIATPTFSINGVSKDLGENLNISLHGVASATNSINLSVIDEVLYGYLRLSDNTLSLDSGGLRLTTDSLSVNGLSGTLGSNIQIPTVAGHCSTPSIITYNHESHNYPGEEHLCADIRLSDTSLQVLSTGLSGLRIAPAGVSATHISIDSVQTEHISAGVVTTDKIADDNITTAKIADDNITTDKIADGSITSAKIADGTVIAADVADGSITTDKIAASAVTTSRIADESITTDKIVDQAITTTKIDSGSVTADKLATGSVTTTKINSSAVTTAKINASAVTTAKINASAVTTAKINDDAVTNAKIATPTFSVNGIEADLGGNISLSLHGAASATDTITLSVVDDVISGYVNDGAITEAKLADTSVTNAKLGPDAVTNDKIADGSINAEQLTDNTVQESHISAGSVTNAKLGPDAVTGDKIADDAIGNEHLQDDTVDTDNIIAGSVTNAKLGADAVTSDKIADASIGNEHLQDDTVDTDSIIAGSVTNAKLGADAVTNDKIADGSINAEQLTDNTVQTDHVSAGVITNVKLATPTFSVNGHEAQLGNNVSISTQDDPMLLNHSTMASLSAGIGTTATTFDTYPLAGCETFSYVIQVKHPDHGLHHRQITNLMVIYDGTDVQLVETGMCSLDDDIANFTAAISGDDILIQAYHVLGTGEASLKAVRTCFS